MSDLNIILPSKMNTVNESPVKGTYSIDGLYPGYGHTLGNSLRRIILSSIPGTAITSVKIDGVDHEFSVVNGVKEDVITMLLHLKQVRFHLSTEESQTVSLSVKGPKVITAADIKCSGQVEVLNPELYIAEITEKESLNMEITIERGLGFMPKDIYQKSKMEVGAIALDAIFTPIRRVSYEVEDMRVGDKTNHNRLTITIETDGSLTPKEALQKSIVTMVEQLQSVLGFVVEKKEISSSNEDKTVKASTDNESSEEGSEFTDTLKTRIDTLDLSTRTLNALAEANIRTIGGIARKKKEDLLEIEGIGEKGINEIKKALANYNISLKE
jgi:DNA-directed RNA polymerase subunit alpha